MHRYGRHGSKAWLRWRNRHFRKTHLVPSPHIAVFNVPLDFLARIQKVVIVMQDGSRLEVENNVSQPQLDGQHALTADERYLVYASGLAKYSAEKDYATVADPYTFWSRSRSDIEEEAYRLYLSMIAHNDQFTTWSTGEEAVTDYLNHFETIRLKRLEELSGATTKGTRELVVVAVKDRKKDGTASSERIYNIRAIIRAYQSLVVDGHISDALPDEELFLIQNRAMLYHNRYDQNHSRDEADLKEDD